VALFSSCYGADSENNPSRRSPVVAGDDKEDGRSGVSSPVRAGDDVEEDRG